MYGSVRKKLSVMADTTAVTRAAERPPSSATTIVKAMKTKARFDAEVSERSGISTKPSARPPSAPATIHRRLSLPGFMASVPSRAEYALSHHSHAPPSEHYLPSSARLTLKTLTRGSPRMPRKRPSVCCSTSCRTAWGSSFRAFATRVTWYRAAAGLM